MPARSPRSQSRGRSQTPASRAASQSSRRSRPPSLTRVYSGHINESASYYHEHDEHVHPFDYGHADDDDDADADNADADLEKPDSSSAPRDSEEAIEEIEDGREFDIEKQPAPPLKKSQSSRSIKKDPNVVTWDGPDDPENPKNWSMKRKWAAVTIVSAFTFLSPTTSTIVSPALPSMEADLNYRSSLDGDLMLSIFILGYAFGPLFLGPLSEMYGRVPVLQLANLWFFVFNLACGFAKTGPQMLAFRLLSGLGGSAPLAIGGGVLGDCFRPEQRGLAISIYSLGPLLGPAIGPVCGGFIAEYSTWRWAFWATSIVDIFVQLLGLFFLQETWSPKLLHNKTKKLIKQTGNTALRSEFDDTHRVPIHRKFQTSLSRPFVMLATQPIIQVLAVYMAYLYGIAYLVLATFPTLWTDLYHESVGIAGLNFISQAIGYFLGSQVGARINDAIYRRLKARNGGVGRPEFRVPTIVPAAVLMPVGLFWYGWSAQARVHWIMPNIGACLFSVGIVLGFQSIQTYIVDAYTRYAASGIAAATVLRSLAGFGFPLFAPAMYARLGYGWGNTLLGCLAIVLGVPAPILLWRYGEALRRRSTFAAGGE